MSDLAWITASGLLMSAIALVGSVTLLFSEAALHKLLLPLVALAAGALLGGALLVLVGFALFFALEQFLHWHHCHRAGSDCKQPLTYLILIGDGLHNLLGGLSPGRS
jgi:zinc and cadmium transporter